MSWASLIDLKERVALAEAFTPKERAFILEAINAAAEAMDAFNAAAEAAPLALDTGNYLGRIETIWACLSVDEGGEGVCAAPLGGDDSKRTFGSVFGAVNFPFATGECHGAAN